MNTFNAEEFVRRLEERTDNGDARAEEIWAVYNNARNAGKSFEDAAQDARKAQIETARIEQEELDEDDADEIDLGHDDEVEPNNPHSDAR